MQLSLILVDENEKELDVLKVEQVIIINSEQYAVVQKDDDEQTFCKVIKHFDGSMRLADIVDDSEFQTVKDTFSKFIVQ